MFDYNSVLRLNEIQKKGIDINKLEESKKVLDSIKHISTITPSSSIKKDEIDKLLTKLLPTLFIICDLSTLSLFIQIIAMNDISFEISNSNKDTIISSLERIYTPPVIFSETSFKIQHSKIQNIVIEKYFNQNNKGLFSMREIINNIINELK